MVLLTRRLRKQNSKAGRDGGSEGYGRQSLGRIGMRTGPIEMQRAGLRRRQPPLLCCMGSPTEAHAPRWGAWRQWRDQAQQR